MSQITKTILAEWQTRNLPKLVKRDFILDIEKNNIVRNATVITGFRRVGKTYVVFEAVERLLKKYSKNDVVYINFEDERLVNSGTEILTGLIPDLISVFGKKPKFLFLDEIQIVPNWSKWVRRMLDSEDIEIVITGSSSKMGSNELPTELRGRAWEIKIEPLNFEEFVRFKNESQEDSKFKYLFNEFLKFGGLPAVVLTEEDKKLELLQLYFSTVVQREILDRYKINNKNALRILLKFLLNSNYITVSRLFNNLKSMGLSVGKTTIDKYINYIKSSYFMSELNLFNYKVINQLMYPRKNYFVDNGFITSLSTKFSTNYGRLFENSVYQKLIQRNSDIYYWKDNKDREVDFVAINGNEVKSLYQACYDITDPETLQREIKSLLRAKKVLKCDNLNLIVFENDNDLKEIKGVNIISALDFFVSPNSPL
ncbi:MAG: hypothetical protein ACD_19C00426G0006 [uncultured bacterium]|nr:MAG: hypothetical protein ACD_19C00426G0006 [uncultured bacterium]